MTVHVLLDLNELRDLIMLIHETVHSKSDIDCWH